MLFSTLPQLSMCLVEKSCQVVKLHNVNIINSLAAGNAVFNFLFLLPFLYCVKRFLIFFFTSSSALSPDITMWLTGFKAPTNKLPCRR